MNFYQYRVILTLLVARVIEVREVYFRRDRLCYFLVKTTQSTYKRAGAVVDEQAIFVTERYMR